MTRKGNSLTTSYGVPKPKHLKSDQNASQMACQTGKKKKKARKRRSRRGGGNGTNLIVQKRLCDAVCSQIDPFCNNCCEGLYDQNSSRVFRVSLRSFVDVVTNASGYAAVEFAPSWVDTYKTASTFTGTAVNAWNAAVDSPFYNATTISHYRIISMGMRFLASCAPTDAQGIVVLRVADTSRNIDLNNFNLYKDSYQDRLYQSELSWVARPKGPEAFEFIELANTHPAWEYGYFSVSNAKASTTIGRLEFVLNVEALPGTTTTMGSIMTQEARPSVPLITDVASNVQAKMKPFVDETEGKSTSKSIMSMVESAVADAIVTYGPQALEAVVGMLL
jgi:hypothetical protein